MYWDGGGRREEAEESRGVGEGREGGREGVEAGHVGFFFQCF
jgi:hypothetical protein